MNLPPIVKTIEVRRPPEDAFRIFTEEIDSWWPLDRFSVGGGEAASCSMEVRVGGRIVETTKSGEEHVWGTVEVVEPPTRLVFTWHPGREPSTAQTVELIFEAVPGGTRVTLEHRGWETLGNAASETRAQYDGGWDLVFGTAFGRRCDTAGVVTGAS